jgi:hypothetical protein
MLMTPGVTWACPNAPWETAEFQVVPANGGVFLDGRLGLAWDTQWLRPITGARPDRAVRLEEDMNTGDLYHAEPALRPWTTYQVATRERSRWLRHGPKVLAVAWRDDQAPVWLGSPRVESASYLDSCVGDRARIDLIVPVVDPSTVQIQIEARPLIGSVETAHAVQVVNEGCAAVEWSIWPDSELVPGMPYVATVCARDAAGNRSCAPAPVLFVAPRYGQEATDEPEGRTLPDDGVVQTPPSDWMPQAAPVRDELDWPYLWRIARWSGLALLLLVILALRRARLRRSIRGA